MVVIMQKHENLLDAARQTPYYNENNHNINTLDNFQIITKQIVCCNHEKFISHSAKKKEHLTLYTSGSTGTPLKIIWAPLDYCSSLAELWKVRKEFGVYPNDKIVTYHAVFYNGSKTIHNRAIVQKNTLSLSVSSLNNSEFAYYYNLVLSFQPKFMLLSPSFVFGFINYLNSNQQKLPESIKLVELTGEACSQELFEWFQTNYPLINWKIMYGMQEFNGIAYGTPNGLHILNNNVFLEIVDEFGNTTKAFQEGNIIITGLKNYSFPLIRYKTEDKGYFDSEGMLHLTCSRSNDSFYYNGLKFDGAIFWTVILHLQQQFNVSILQFQVKYKQNQFCFYLVVDQSPFAKGNDFVECISEFLAKQYSIYASVLVNIVSRIKVEQEKNKIKYFINDNYFEEEKNEN